MKGNLRRLAALCIVVSSAVVQAAQIKPTQWDGYYVATAQTAGTVSVTAEVDVFSAYEGQALYIDFKVARSDGVTLGAVGAGRDAGARALRFSFTDNFGRRGRGTFSRSGDDLVLRLVPRDSATVPTAGASLYGEYKMTKKAARGEANRHPWSLGRNRPGPDPAASGSSTRPNR